MQGIQQLLQLVILHDQMLHFYDKSSMTSRIARPFPAIPVLRNRGSGLARAIYNQTDAAADRVRSSLCTLQKLVTVPPHLPEGQTYTVGTSYSGNWTL